MGFGIRSFPGTYNADPTRYLDCDSRYFPGSNTYSGQLERKDGRWI